MPATERRPAGREGCLQEDSLTLGAGSAGPRLQIRVRRMTVTDRKTGTALGSLGLGSAGRNSGCQTASPPKLSAHCSGSGSPESWARIVILLEPWGEAGTRRTEFIFQMHLP